MFKYLVYVLDMYHTVPLILPSFVPLPFTLHIKFINIFENWHGNFRSQCCEIYKLSKVILAAKKLHYNKGCLNSKNKMKSTSRVINKEKGIKMQIGHPNFEYKQ